nr:unnamed protein product [Digitaria exilis]
MDEVALRRLIATDWQARCRADITAAWSISSATRRSRERPCYRYVAVGGFLGEVAVAEGGRRLHAAQRLVVLAEGGHFAPAAHLTKTRFCTVCGLSFCHYSCPDHSRHQHPLPPPESMTVVRFDGWAAVPAGQLPAAYVENVQV